MAVPAHCTKHLSSLSYPFLDKTFILSQLDDGRSNGTALWLGAQCLSFYFAAALKKPSLAHSMGRPKALELGSGIGLTALVLSSLGWDVLATDTRHVITTVLRQNIGRNHSRPHDGAIQIRELDWTVPPEHWDWTRPTAVASLHVDSSPHVSEGGNALHRPPFDLIVTSDTLYTPELVTPLLRTLHSVSMQSLNLSSRSPPVYLCIERRDPAVIDRALHEAKTEWNFDLERITHRKLVKAMEKGGLKWARDDWDGIEIWKLVLRTAGTNGRAVPSQFPEVTVYADNVSIDVIRE